MKLKLIIQTTAATVAVIAAFSMTCRADDAKAIWEKNCVSCHGKDGKGETTMGKKVDVKDYTDAKVQSAFTDEQAIKNIKEGVKDDKGKVRMKAYSELLSDEDIKGLVTYLRTFKK